MNKNQVKIVFITNNSLKQQFPGKYPSNKPHQKVEELQK